MSATGAMSASKYSKDEMLAVIGGRRYVFSAAGALANTDSQCLMCALVTWTGGQRKFPQECWTPAHCRCTPEIRKDGKRGYWKEAADESDVLPG